MSTPHMFGLNEKVNKSCNQSYFGLNTELIISPWCRSLEAVYGRGGVGDIHPSLLSPQQSLQQQGSHPKGGR